MICSVIWRVTSASLACLCALAAPARAEQHPVFSLVDNRPLAHLQRRGGLYIEAGTAAMAKYVHFSRPLANWKQRLVEDGRKVALAAASAGLEVPLTAAQAQSQTLYLGLKVAVRSSVKVAAHGKASAPTTLAPGWQVVTVKLADGELSAGENNLTFTFAQYGTFAGQKAAAAIEFIQVGGTPPAQADPIGKGSPVLTGGSGLAYFAYVPDGGALSVHGSGAGCTLSAAVDGGAPAEVMLDGTPLDLSSHARHFVRLDLLASASCPSLTLGDGALLAAGPAAARSPKAPPRNVVLWISDSTRADKWKAINPKTRVETPFFSELAKQSTLFSAGYVQGNESRASHASLFTSLYPGVHKMINEHAKLSSELTILPETIKQGKLFTAGVMGNGYIDKFWGFGDGWDFLHNHIHDGGGLSAGDLWAEGKKLLGMHDGKPMFLYIGSIDCHVTWRAHEPWLKKYDPSPYEGPFVKAALDPIIEKVVTGKMHLNERDHTRLLALYDSDVSYTDDNLRQLFDELKKRGHDQDTMIIFSADHGEELYDHGKLGHGQSLHEELTHVPLLIYYPPLFPAGKVVEEGAEVMDLLPTIADALGVPAPDAAQGESLIPLAEGVTAGYPRPAIASQYELAHMMRLGAYKLWVGGSGEARLFDAVNDLHEDKDLYQSNPTVRRALTDAMGLWMANRNVWKKRKWGVASNLSPGFAADNGM